MMVEPFVGKTRKGDFRQREIQAIEARVRRLRAQLEKRRSSKQQIIDLQLKVIEYEASGLGLFLYEANQPWEEWTVQYRDAQNQGLAAPTKPGMGTGPLGLGLAQHANAYFLAVGRNRVGRGAGRATDRGVQFVHRR